MNLNRKGFTIVETLAVVVILTIIMAIMVPSVNVLIKKNQEDRLKDLKNSIISATRIFFSDYKYEVKFDDTNNICSAGNTLTIASVNTGEEISLTNSCFPVQPLIAKKYVKTKDGYIANPKDSNEVLDYETSCVTVKYNCDDKNFIFNIENGNLKWKEKE